MARLLLVDDDVVNRLTLGALLEDAGYEIVEAEGLSDARAVLGRSPIDLVLLDQNLADGSGCDIIPVIRAQQPQARVLIVSGSPPEEGVQGTHGFVLKGEGPEILLRTINRLLGRK